MTIKKALDHISFKLQKVWKTTDTDQEAIDTIYHFVNQKQKQQFNDNQLFAKLYITFYGELLTYFDATVFDKIPQKELNRILDEPIQLIIKKFLSKANDQETWQRMKDAGIELGKHPRLTSPEQKAKEAGLMDVKMLEPFMTYEEAENNLTAMINHALNSFN